MEDEYANNLAMKQIWRISAVWESAQPQIQILIDSNNRCDGFDPVARCRAAQEYAMNSYRDAKLVIETTKNFLVLVKADMELDLDLDCSDGKA